MAKKSESKKRTTRSTLKKPGSRTRSGQSVQRPVSPASNALPLRDPAFTWERFEEFSHHLVSLLPKVESSHRYGTRGSDQKGIDIAANLANGKEETYQCKQYETFSASDVRKVIAEHEYKASRHTIVTTCIVGVPVRDEVKKHRKWRLWDATDICLKIRKLDSEQAALLIAAHFGPEWVKAFLHRDAFATFVSPGLYYARLMDPSRIFHHGLPLVGRTAELDTLHGFVEAEDTKIFVLPGVGGSGKSRLLVAFFEKFRDRHPGWHVRVVNDGLDVTADSAKELPVGDCLIAVDDAHRRSDVRAILTLASQRPGRTKVVFVLRQHGMSFLDSELAWTHLAPSSVLRAAPLPRLKKPESRELAAEALGKDYMHYADALTTATGDSPLVMVVAANLLKTQSVHPRTLEQHAEFRQIVLQRFADEASARFKDGPEREIAQRLLPLIAALQPLHVDEGLTGRAAMAAFLNVPEDVVVRIVGDLEAAGVLVRRGRIVRIVPDVLADDLLHRYCMNASGMPTGYADEVYVKFGQTFGARVLQNLAELDWRIRAGRGQRLPILDGVWRKILSDFEALPHSGRAQMLRDLREVALLQPERALRLVEYAISNVSNAPEDEIVQAFGISSHDHVLHAVPPVLRNVAYHVPHVRRCCELLWNIGHDDQRPANPFLDHPMRVLTEIAGYSPHKPVTTQERVLDMVELLVQRPDAYSYEHSPLDIVDPILERSGISHESDGRTVTMAPFLISRTATASVRERAIRVIENAAMSADTRVAIRALKSLGHLLRGLLPPLGAKASDDSYHQWGIERLQVVEILGRILNSTGSDVVRLAVMEMLRPFARSNSRASLGITSSGNVADEKAVGTAAGKLLTSIGSPFSLRLVKALKGLSTMDFYAMEDPETDRFSRASVRLNDCAKSLAIEFVSAYRDPDAGLAAVLQNVRDLTAADCEVNPHIWFYALGETNPEYALEFTDQAIKKSYIEILRSMGSLLAVPYRTATTKARALLARVIVSSDVAMRAAASHMLAHAILPDYIGTQELEWAHQLVADADPGVRYAVVWVLARLKEQNLAEAVKLASKIRIGDDSRVAHEFLMLYTNVSSNTSIMRQSSDEDLSGVLAQLLTLPTIDDHWILEFLSACAQRVPEQLISFLASRIDAVNTADSATTYAPLPYGDELKLEALAACSNVDKHLRSVFDRYRAATGGRRFWLRKLFASISQRLEMPQAMKLLSEWVDCGDANLISEAASLVAEAGRQFVLSHVEWISGLLKRAAAVGQECYREVEGYLRHAVESGTKVGTAGEPFPMDVSLKEQASRIAVSLPEASPERLFFERLERNADQEIRRAISEDEELET